MAEESPIVHAFVVFTDLVSGTEHIVRRQTFGDDQQEAAEQAFESLAGAQVRIREIVTFTQKPLTWQPDYRVRQVGQPLGQPR